MQGGALLPPDMEIKMNLQQIQNEIKKKLSEKRYYHSECVMERCEELGKKFDFDIEIAKKVGISHDIAKELTDEEKIKYCAEKNIEVDEMEKKNISLLHAKIGANMVKELFGFNEQMCFAIRAHTTGLPQMDMLSKILFIADRTSKERNFPDIEYLNQLLEEGIDKAVLYILDKKIELQLKKQANIHINTVITRNDLLQKM